MTLHRIEGNSVRARRCITHKNSWRESLTSKVASSISLLIWAAAGSGEQPSALNGTKSGTKHGPASIIVGSGHVLFATRLDSSDAARRASNYCRTNALYLILFG